MPFPPDLSVLIGYSLACLILFATPGPDMSLFLAKTLSGGRRAGMAAMTGASLGCVIHALAAAFGLTALIAASPTLFLGLKIVGAAYLFWLAMVTLRSGSALNLATSRATPSSFWRTLGLGLSINLTNPKAVLFFLTFLPQFVAADDARAGGKLLFLGLYFVLLTYPLAALLILAADRAVRSLKRHPGVLRVIDWLFAGIFGAFAVRILVTPSR